MLWEYRSYKQARSSNYVYVDILLVGSQDWHFHKKFYKKIIDILAEDGSLLMTSCFGARQPEEWVDMCDLKIKKVFINQPPIGITYPSNYILSSNI